MSTDHVSSKSTNGPNESRRQSFPQCQSTPNIDPAHNEFVNRPSEVAHRLSAEQLILNCVHNQSSSEGSCELMEESSQAVVRHAVSGYCDICGPVGQPMSEHKLDMHRRHKHDPFTCIRCYGQFAGEDRLVDHIHTVKGLSGTDQQNSVCVPVDNPNVRMLCTYCPYGERGNDYRTYLSLVRHIRSLHPGSVSISSRREEGEVEVQVQSGKCRPLTSSEISLMLVQSNLNLPGTEGTDGVGAAALIERAPPVKRRRVAIKSTARPTASQPIQRVASMLPAESELQHQLSTSGSKG